MAVAVTNTTLTALNASKTKVADACTSTVTNGAEVITITPTKGCAKMLIELAQASTLTFTYSIAAATTYSGAKAITGTVGVAPGSVIQVDTCRVLSTTGTVVITLTPSTGVALVAGHTAKVSVFELL